MLELLFISVLRLLMKFYIECIDAWFRSNLHAAFMIVHEC